MRCPICKKPVVSGLPEFPFCSERCRLIDLGNWAAEKYVISTPVRPAGEEADPRPLPPLHEEEDE
jgi:endogenous inhibitor of DNA gyrase (YacG/DUF329 family)